MMFRERLMMRFKKSATSIITDCTIARGTGAVAIKSQYNERTLSLRRPFSDAHNMLLITCYYIKSIIGIQPPPNLYQVEFGLTLSD